MVSSNKYYIQSFNTKSYQILNAIIGLEVNTLLNNNILTEK